MNKINANTIIKNLTGIFCGAIILCLLLPLFSAEANVSAMGVSAKGESNSFSGFDVLTGGGFLGLMLVICPIIILIANYLPQFGKYKKIVSLIMSVVGVVVMFVVSSVMSSTNYSATGQAATASSKASVEAHINYLFGFWLMLIFYVAIVALSAIQFFNLKGNKVFDAVNSDNSDESVSSVNMPQINLEKVTELAKNTANAVSAQVKNVTNNIPKSENSNTQENAYTQKDNTVSANNQPVSYQTPGNTEQAEPHNFGMLKKIQKPVAPTPKENPEVIMNLIKQLFEMKESGILTEEEFSEKKQELLNKM